MLIWYETGLTQKQELAEIGAKSLPSSAVSAGLLGVLEEGIALEEARYGCQICSQPIELIAALLERL